MTLRFKTEQQLFKADRKTKLYRSHHADRMPPNAYDDNNCVGGTHTVVAAMFTMVLGTK
jgi:hypothetical protein